MVLEYCEMPLKDWLSNIKSINSDALEDMSMFTLNIANGMKHLHENQVRSSKISDDKICCTNKTKAALS